MTRTVLSLLLSAQLLCAVPQPQRLTMPAAETATPVRLWWSLIDPDLALWFAHIPEESASEEEAPVLWDWSWRGFLAALFGRPLAKEEPTHA